MSSIECISLNVRGLRNIHKRKRIFRRLKERKADVICLQETYVTDDVIVYRVILTEDRQRDKCAK